MQPDSSVRACEQCGRQFTLRRPGSRPNQRFHSLRCYGAWKRAHPKPIALRFWSRVRQTDTCWLWTGSTNRHGYGYVGVPGYRRPILAHRVAWELTNGLIPRGLLVLHRCDNPPCVRPDHLFIGTHADNMQDAKEKGRTTQGQRNAASKLTDERVLLIRRRFAVEDITISALAREYGVGPKHMSNLLKRKIWTHLS